MKGDFQIPVRDEQYFLNNNHEKKSSDCMKIYLLLIGVLLLIITSIMIALTFRSFNEINNMKQEIEKLKSSLKIVNEKISEDQYDDFYTEDLDETKMISLYNEDEDQYSDLLDGDYESNNVLSDDLNIILTSAVEKGNASRDKRSIVGYNEDGVPVNSETYDETRRRNRFGYQFTTSPPSTRSYPFSENQETEQDATSISRPTYSRLPQSTRRSNLLRSGDLEFRNSEGTSDNDFTVVRRSRIGRMRPLPTAHFNGDTSKYIFGHHENFHGNGRLRHPQKTYVDWTESSWFRDLGMDEHFEMQDGIVTIKEAGLYFVYAQIYYFDEHDINGFIVHKNGNPLLQCTTMTHSSTRVMKGNTCYTAAAEYLQENDRISLEDVSGSRYSLFQPGKSFFGLIKLGDVKIRK